MRRKSVGDEELLHELRKKGGNIARVCVRVRIYGLFMAASADLIIQYWMVGVVVNNEWNSMWKEAMVTYLKVMHWYSIADTDEN